MPTIYFDEAGNTGAALTDQAQPVFVLASTDMTDQEAGNLLALVSTPQAREAKFTSLRKSDSGRRRLLDLIRAEQLDLTRVKSIVMHKRFMVVTKFVDIIEETLAHASGIDLYERGANLALANVHYFASPVFCGTAPFDEFLESFVEMVRRPSPDTKSRFFLAAREMYERCSNEDHKSSFAPYIYAERCIDEILDGVNYLALDPAIPSFFSLCTVWGTKYAESFHVVHDDSKPMAAERATFEAMMDRSIEPTVIGYDRRKFEFPLKATGITFADSVSHPALQLADLIAGATSYWAAAMARGEEDEFAQALDSAGIQRFVFDALWPSTDVTPEALGTDEIGGINAPDHIAKALAGRKT
ncbi:DUF3800 domain-containing protein [Aromatoleum evansii]|uniref:DUF3800 domain-containing protein n=1 Tax=Aromatoleum evansii TaxID=59406 RepID=UPI00145D5699|nr:DUF3800 domain-containing protein [Aromatoleum evansii]NMG28445.1 DUF3800 domain-containing protein [Aromatoleum evansii]